MSTAETRTKQVVVVKLELLIAEQLALHAMPQGRGELDSIHKSPDFTLLAVAIMALGIGTNTAGSVASRPSRSTALDPRVKVGVVACGFR